MSTQIIKANPSFKLEVSRTNPYLNVAEFFTDTIQGEGVSTGCPATFLRLQDCTLDCVWCDSASVWKYGNPYEIDSLIELMKTKDVLYNITQPGHRFVITGGSPLKQQRFLVEFLRSLHTRVSTLGESFYIEVENECVLKPSTELCSYVSQWNNSPKLSNSGMRKEQRIKPEILKYMSSLSNSWFKFVVATEGDWDEIVQDFIEPGYIKKEQVIVMPCGESRTELELTRDIVLEIAIREGVRYSDRLHVICWDKKTGV